MKFNIIYADPPWLQGGRTKKHYKHMRTKDICNLSVPQITADDAVLFLWTTFMNLPDAMQVIPAWGFQYKSVAFTWIKPNNKSKGWFFGTGYWARGNAEICLLATKGHPKRVSRRVSQLIVEPRREHSRKPDVARQRIVQLCGDLPRIELFARQTHDGWHRWGNQVESTIQLEATP